ncbi:nuclear transport factor 2 family protein [Streptomyces sp. NBC_00820]|uniref:nuclear transport factor 2 family protein n=1 Tax=Streptomyces sp. NBC_00820 TaxID=2975842 RepID=UPI002ED1A358|nr:nuclear transport factor 2 family protein [Streptomyces sp. NBC_00820]
MTIQPAKLSDPAVRAFVNAVNAHDREGFMSLLVPGATMADDGSDRDLAEWIDQEIFSSNGHMEVDNESRGGRALLARYRNDTYGEMQTKWTFTVADDGRIARFETGQA